MSPALERLMSPVAAAIDSDKTDLAVQRFMEVLSHDSALGHADLVPLLRETLGRARTKHLIDAFTRRTCMACKRGLLLCDECEGRGSTADQRVCDPCIGLGTSICGFCAGSGWITYNYVPAGLRIPVAIARTRLTLSETRPLLEAALPKNPAVDDADRRKLARELLVLNRLLSALNNAVGVARHPPRLDDESAAALGKIRSACLRAGRAIDRRIRALLTKLHESHTVVAAQARDSDLVELSRRRANYYAALAESSDFIGTSLHHPYLRRL